MMKMISAALSFTIALMLSIMTEFSALGFIPKLEPKKVSSFSALSLFPPNGGSEERGGFGRGRGRGRGDRGRGRGRGRGRILPPPGSSTAAAGNTTPNPSAAAANEPVRRLDVNPNPGGSLSIVSPTRIVAPAPKKP